MLIINADDYGLNPNTTKATLAAFDLGFCSSATIVPNGVDFLQAAELAHQKRIATSIGIHLNIIEGKPLTEPIRKLTRFCDNEGNFHPGGIILSLSPKERRALALEVRAQIEKCRRAGLKLSHADSHHHAHTRWPMWGVINPILNEYGIKRVRISRNCGPKLSAVKVAYKTIFNYKLKQCGFITTNYFGSVEEMLPLYNSAPALAAQSTQEVMIHPLFNTQGELIDLDSPCLTSLVKNLPHWQTAVSFNQLS